MIVEPPMARWWFALVVGLLVPQQAVYPVRWTPAVGPPDRRALARQPIKLPPKTALEGRDDSGRTYSVRTCAEYARAMRRGFEPLDNAQIATRSFFVDQCDVVALILTARPSRVSHVTTFALDDGVLDELPPVMTFALSGDAEHAAADAQARGLSWRRANPEAKITKRISANEIRVDEGDDAYHLLELKAFGDFNGDEVEDVLLFQASYATHGTFHSYEPVVLTRTSPTGPLKVVKLPKRQ